MDEIQNAICLSVSHTNHISQSIYLPIHLPTPLLSDTFVEIFMLDHCQIDWFLLRKLLALLSKDTGNIARFSSF